MAMEILEPNSNGNGSDKDTLYMLAGLSLVIFGAGCANSFSRTQYSAHLSSMAVGSYALGRSWGMVVEVESPGIAPASLGESCEQED